jgi:Domain of unknown function (DUF4279)
MAAISLSTAALRIFGESLDPNEISQRLGCAPTHSHRKGELRSTRTNMLHRMGMWRLVAEDSEPEALDAQVARLLDKVTPDLEVWKDLGTRFSVDMFCGLFMNESNEGLELSPSTLHALGQRGISLSLDVYGPTNEEHAHDATAPGEA